MNKTTNRFGQDTLDAINDLRNQGIGGMAVIIRHSARRYDLKEWKNDAYMGLTNEGKELSYEFGKNLSTDSVIRLFSSPVGRCIETAYQIEKGNIFKGGKTETNRIIGTLATFFANDFLKVFEGIVEKGTTAFFRDWFSGKVPVEIMADPEKAAEILVKLLIDQLNEMQGNHIDILVSHDWCLYVLKEYYLGLTQEDVGITEYLEGIIVYKENGEFFITNHQTEPKILELSGE